MGFERRHRDTQLVGERQVGEQSVEMSRSTRARQQRDPTSGLPYRSGRADLAAPGGPAPRPHPLTQMTSASPIPLTLLINRVGVLLRPGTKSLDPASRRSPWVARAWSRSPW